jgi:O-antigen/teichoic acid export membrane protein
MDERNKGLLKNTSILLIGNFLSKLLAFILVPIYTHYFSPSEYGEIDFYLIILTMLYILVSLQSIESAFRFVQDSNKKENVTSTITNASTIAFVGIIIFIIVMLVYGKVTSFQYTYIFIGFVSTSIFANMFLETIRGMNKTTSYVMVNVISTVISSACNILFVVGIGIGAIALLITPIIANVLVITIILYKERFIQYFKASAVCLKEIKEQLYFSIPLIPNAISIWLLSAIGRFVLLFYYGAHSVGILAFALKFPLLLGVFSSVFYMAWQISAVSQYNANDKNIFASNVFNQYALLLLTSLLLFLPAVKVLIFTIMGDAFIEAWLYIPIFLIGVVVRAFAQFYNVGFYGAKKTIVVFHSSLIAAIIYFTVSMILAQYLYILGIAIAYATSEVVYWLYIIRKVSPYLKISINYKKLIPVLMSVIIFIIVYYTANWKIQIGMTIIGLFLALVFNYQLINKLYKTYFKSSMK